MMGLIQSAYVIGRRDFIATVYSKAFILFLVGPLLPIAFGFFFGSIGDKVASGDVHPKVAIVSSEGDFREIEAAHAALAPGFAEKTLPDLVHVEPDYDVPHQVTELLAAKDKKVLAVLTGGLARPTLTGAVSETGSVQRQVGLILDEARQRRALRGAGAAPAPVEIAVATVEESAGSLAVLRALTAQFGQLLLFVLVMFLAGMLLSNLIEEKSNKVLEVLAAAVPVNAIFLGKLFAMLAVSVVGITVWGIAAAVAAGIWLPDTANIPEPAVGWPFFCILIVFYFAASYLLLGALFLGIGSQASTVREVQVMSMPVTMGQLVVFGFAAIAVGAYDSFIGIAAAIFPFSSPFTMIARAAQTPEIWPHLLALGWQALWVWLIIRLSASLFRRSVMKSGPALSLRGMRQRKT